MFWRNEGRLVFFGVNYPPSLANESKTKIPDQSINEMWPLYNGAV